MRNKVKGQKLYEIYDHDNVLVCRGTSAEIAEKMGCRRIYISQYALNHHKLFKKFLVKDLGLINPELSKRQKKKLKLFNDDLTPKRNHPLISRENTLFTDIIESQDISKGTLIEILKDDEHIEEICKVNDVYRHIFTVVRKAGYLEAFTFTQLYRKDGVRISQNDQHIIQ